MEALNRELVRNCAQRDQMTTSGRRNTIGELFEQEKFDLVNLPETEFKNYQLLRSKVNKFMVATIDRNYYSVPKEYIGRKVVAELGINEVRLTVNDRLIAKHKRLYARGEWSLDPWHYLSVLCRKPKAFSTSRIASVIEGDWNPVVKKLWNLHIQKYGENCGTKEFLKTLNIFKDTDENEMIAMFEMAIENNTYSRSNIEMLHQIFNEDQIKVEEISLDKITKISNFEIPTADLEKFDLLLGDEDEQGTDVSV